MVHIGLYMLLVNYIEKLPVQLILFLPQRDKKEILSSICCISVIYANIYFTKS